jgi:hypothetical protein
MRAGRQRPFEIAFHRFERAQEIVVADTMAEARRSIVCGKGPSRSSACTNGVFFAIAI